MARRLLISVTVSLCSLVLACSSGGTSVTPGDSADIPGQDTSRNSGDLPGAETPDFGSGKEQPALDLERAVGFGAPCESNDDCPFCVDYADGKVCSQTCVEECPQGWHCELYSGVDPVWICISDFANLCRPCKGHADCYSLSGTVDKCVVYGEQAAFCGANCEYSSECPEGFACVASPLVDGEMAKQCVLVEGECPCGDTAVTRQLATSCYEKNEFGMCTGERVCTADGLAPCDALIPGPESCDGVDNDCDGMTDDVEGDECCVCGDGSCHAHCESPETCCADCATCGNGKCECGEGPVLCPVDCCGTCGDDVCASFEPCQESKSTCADDCGKMFACGDGNCQGNENPESCVEDCGKYVCGNHVCEPGEGVDECPVDCDSDCGDCKCEGDESFLNCPVDCGWCGDGYCSPCSNLGETAGTCIPDCCIPDCTGKQCGPDGCLGSCGECPTEQYLCTDGQCICQPDCVNKVCGSDGCGGTCGDCPCGNSCQEGACVFSACSGKQCGSDGCGGSCGNCPAGTTCSNGQCVCAPNCSGKQCGPNGCGGSCGGCPANHVCDAAGHCICQPNCAGKECGSNGCGGSCSPGCPSYKTCNGAGKCDCKPGACGGGCPGCAWDWECVNNYCQCKTPSCDLQICCGNSPPWTVSWSASGGATCHAWCWTKFDVLVFDEDVPCNGTFGPINQGGYKCKFEAWYPCGSKCSVSKP